LSGREARQKKEDKMNFDKEIWEGWTVGDFINELEPQFNAIMTNKTWQKPFTTKAEVKAWTIDTQPSYKKQIPDVVTYFWNKVTAAK
jgi:hypothetical protein